MASYFTWSEFDKGVDFIAKKCKSIKSSGIYGIPRGGLCLAVALSHKLNIDLISEPIKNSIVVDDIYETGETLNSLKNIEGVIFFVLISKKKPTWWNTVYLADKKDWIVFPWENKNVYIKDQEKYLNKRRIL